MRFKKSFESEENWYKINRYGGRLLAYWSVVIVGAGVACFFIPFDDDVVLIAAFGLAPLVLLIPAIQCYRYAQQQ